MNDGAALGLVLDQVSKDKNIDRAVLVETLEQAILTAAKRAFGMHREMEAKFNEETGRVDLFQIIVIVEQVTPGRVSGADPGGRCRRASSDRRQRVRWTSQRYGLKAEVGDELLFQIFYDEKDQAKAEEQDAKYGELLEAEPRLEGLRPHRRPDRQAGDPAARARGRARERLQPVQGPQGRADLRHRPPLRARQHHRRPRRRRGGAAGARAGAARVVPRRRPHRRLRRRHRQDARAGRRSSCRARTRACSRSCSRWRSRRSTRRSCASRRRPARRARASKIAGQLARSRRRSGRRLRRHEGLARAGGRAGAARREDRHRPLRRRIRRASCATRSRPPRSRASSSTPAATRWS